MKCVNCKYCEEIGNRFIICWAVEPELVDRCVAEDDNLDCDMYVDKLDANDTEA